MCEYCEINEKGKRKKLFKKSQRIGSNCPVCGREVKKTLPYSHEDYLNAKKLGLELDNWEEYQKFYNLGVTSND